jgi:hypothetical protein
MVLFPQHPVLMLLFKQKLCHTLTTWLGSVCFFLLSFSSSCLFSSSLSVLWLFKFACCPQVPEISSIVHQPPCFGVVFSLCWFIGGLFLCLAPFLWGKDSVWSASSLLSVCCDDLLFVFQFCKAV